MAGDGACAKGPIDSISALEMAIALIASAVDPYCAGEGATATALLDFLLRRLVLELPRLLLLLEDTLADCFPFSRFEGDFLALLELLPSLAGAGAAALCCSRPKYRWIWALPLRKSGILKFRLPFMTRADADGGVGGASSN